MNIGTTRFPSGKFEGEWRKDALLSLPDAMNICCAYKITCPEKVAIPHLAGIFLGAINSSTFTLFEFSIDVPMTAICFIVIEKTITLKTQYTICRVRWIILGRGSRFKLQLLWDRQEAARVVGGYDRPTPMAWDVAYKYLCRK